MCLADLTDELKTRCSRLHIAITADDISGAYRLIESHRPLVTAPPDSNGSRPSREAHQTGAGGRPACWTSEEAGALLTSVHAAVTLPVMPAVRQLSADEVRRRQFHRLQRRALQQVFDEIEETERRCADLEVKIT